MKKLKSNEILGIGLLNKDEVKAAGNNIPPLDEWWWLRSPGLSCSAACVDPDGDVSAYGFDVDSGNVGVRPVLYDDKDSAVPIGEKALFGGRVWTHIAKNMFLCDEIIAWMVFRKDGKAADANAYEASDVKAYLDEWLSKALSEHGKSPELLQEEKLRIYYEQAHSFHMQDAERQVTDYIEAEGCEPDNWLDEFDFDCLATMFEDMHDCNVADNNTWTTVIRQYIDEHGITFSEDTYEVYFAVEGWSCVRVKAISKEDAEAKAMNRMEEKDFGDLRDMSRSITDTRLVEPEVGK